MPASRYPIYLAALILHAATAAAQTRRMEIAGAFPSLTVRTAVTIDPATVDGSEISMISANNSGLIAVTDPHSNRLIVFDANGSNRRTIGRKGKGPGEFSMVGDIAWIGDTLLAIDRTSKFGRIHAFPPTTGAVARTFNITTGFFDQLYGGSGVLLAREQQTGQRVTATGGLTSANHTWSFSPVTSSGVGAPIQGLSDTTPPAAGMDCRSADKKYIEILDRAPNGDHGRMRALLSTHALVSAGRDSFVLTIQNPSGQSVQLWRSWTPVPMTNAVWDSAAHEYVAINAKEGPMTCDPPVVEPALNHVIRAIATDEQDRIWIETTEATGSFVYVITHEGKRVGRFKLPAADDRIPWFVRNSRVYQITVDGDGLQGVRVLEIGIH